LQSENGGCNVRADRSSRCTIFTRFHRIFPMNAALHLHRRSEPSRICRDAIGCTQQAKSGFDRHHG